MLSQKEPSDEQSDAVDEPAANSCSREKMALYLKVHTSLKSRTTHGLVNLAALTLLKLSQTSLQLLQYNSPSGKTFQALDNVYQQLHLLTQDESLFSVHDCLKRLPAVALTYSR